MKQPKAERNETTKDEARSHSPAFLEKAARQAKRGGKKSGRGEKRGSGRY